MDRVFDWYSLSLYSTLYMYCIGLIMAVSRPKHVALMQLIFRHCVGVHMLCFRRQYTYIYFYTTGWLLSKKNYHIVQRTWPCSSIGVLQSDSLRYVYLMHLASWNREIVVCISFSFAQKWAQKRKMHVETYCPIKCGDCTVTGIIVLVLFQWSRSTVMAGN